MLLAIYLFVEWHYKYNLQFTTYKFLNALHMFSNTVATWGWLRVLVEICFFVCIWSHSPQWAVASSFTRFLDHTQRRTTVGRTPLDEWSARRRDLYLKTHNTHNRQTSMPLVGFEPTISAGERSQTYALDRAATGTWSRNTSSNKKLSTV